MRFAISFSWAAVVFSACTFFSDTEVPQSPDDVVNDGDTRDGSVEEPFDIPTPNGSLNIMLTGEWEDSWRLGLFRVQFLDYGIETVDEAYSQAISADEFTFAVVAPREEDLEPLWFEPFSFDALFLLAAYDDEDGDGAHSDGDFMEGASSLLLAYNAPTGLNPEGVWLGARFDPAWGIRPEPLPDEIEVSVGQGSELVVISGTVADLSPDANRIATISMWENGPQPGLLPDRPVDQALTTPFSIVLPVELSSQRLEPEYAPPPDAPDGANNILRLGTEYAVAFNDVDGDQTFSMADEELGALCSNGRTVAFIYMPPTDNPEDIWLGLMRNVHLGWNVVPEYMIPGDPVDGELDNIVLSETLCAGRPQPAAPIFGVFPEELTINFVGTPEPDWRVALHLVHRNQYWTYDFEEEYVSEPFESNPITLNVPLPQTEHLGQIDFAPVEASGAMFAVYAYHDEDGDLALSNGETVVAMSTTMLVYVETDGYGSSPYAFSVSFSQSPYMSWIQVEPTAPHELIGLFAQGDFVITGEVDTSNPSDRIASESVVELGNRTPLPGRPIDQELTNPFSISLSDPVGPNRIDSQMHSPFPFSNALEFPIAYQDQNSNSVYDFPDERVAYLCEESRVVAFLYANSTDDVGTAFEMARQGLLYGWNVTAFEGPMPTQVHTADFVFREDQCSTWFDAPVY